MPNWHTFWDTQLLWNSVGDWIVALLALLITLTVLPLVRSLVAARRRRWLESGRERPVAVDLTALLVERTSRLFLWAVAIDVALSELSFPHHIGRAFDVAVVFVFWFQVGLWGMAAVRFAIDRRRQATPGRTDPALAGSIEIIVFVSGLLIWTMALLLALDNLGIAIRPLLAGLGIGGIAVALAVQAVLGDLLASMSIALDKPFTVGDALAVDTFNGTVEHIGVKSTRLRSISGEQIIMSNAELLKSRVRNYGRLRERRSAFELHLTYDTAPETLRRIAPLIREIIEAQPHTRFDRCHLMTCGPTALQFEVVYFVTVADYKVYADTQHSVNLALLERLRELGVQFATPLLAPMPTYREAASRSASAPGTDEMSTPPAARRRE
ncbi:MAG TPA: mechanosensitive ion channel family protein [Steroidobacteraceae bacterium]|nr:mechanosensitive ion channel family protein [Steroidobacteraceae bacterium]